MSESNKRNEYLIKWFYKLEEGGSNSSKKSWLEYQKAINKKEDSYHIASERPVSSSCYKEKLGSL